MKRTAKLAVPLLFGLVLGLAAASAFAMPPRGTGCSGGAALGVCAELGFSVSLCCALFGM
jgi:hypothetical protein